MRGQIAGQIGLFDYSAKWGLKRKYPPESLIAIEGCDHDDCFSCGGVGCRIRGEERYCMYAPLGNPYPCETLKRVEGKPEDFTDRCQFINQDLAYHRAGDHQPTPCCVKCTEECENRCKRATENEQRRKTQE